MPNIKQIIKGHNNKVLSTKTDNQTESESCNCRGECPLNGRCLTPNIVYMAEVNVLNENPDNNIANNNSNINNNNRRSTRNNNTQTNNRRTTRSNNSNDNNVTNNINSSSDCNNSGSNNISNNNTSNNNDNSNNGNNSNENMNDNNSSNDNQSIEHTIPDNSDNTGTEQMFYIGASENFKLRYRNHEKSFRNKIYANETVLSKYIWQLKD